MQSDDKRVPLILTQFLNLMYILEEEEVAVVWMSLMTPCTTDTIMNARKFLPKYPHSEVLQYVANYNPKLIHTLADDLWEDILSSKIKEFLCPVPPPSNIPLQ